MKNTCKNYKPNWKNCDESGEPLGDCLTCGKNHDITERGEPDTPWSPACPPDSGEYLSGIALNLQKIASELDAAIEDGSIELNPEYRKEFEEIKTQLQSV